MTWNPGQYLSYEHARMRPALDLLARIPLTAPGAIVDLGCGAGNVAQVLAARWPQARIVGVDSSGAMLATARDATAGDARFTWIEADLGAWTPETAPDLVFSNAALHWLDDHATLVPRLLAAVAAGGALAVQMPDNFAAPSHAALFEVATRPEWRDRLARCVRSNPVSPMTDYLRWLAAASAVDLWTTEYMHLLPGLDGGEHPVVAWMKGAALTPFLAALDDDARPRFIADYRERIAAAYPPLDDGRVPFPFRRRFVVAMR